MSDDISKTPVESSKHDGPGDDGVLNDYRNGASPPGSIKEEETFKIDESRKIGVTGAVFLILNKMIGTGGNYTCPVL